MRSRFGAGFVAIGLAIALATAPLLATNPIVLLSAVAVTGSGSAVSPTATARTFHVFGATTSGAGATTVVIEVSNVLAPATDADWVTACTITLTLATTRTGDGCVTNAAWAWVRARVSAISGTGATVSAHLGQP